MKQPKASIAILSNNDILQNSIASSYTNYTVMTIRTAAFAMAQLELQAANIVIIDAVFQLTILSTPTQMEIFVKKPFPLNYLLIEITRLLNEDGNNVDELKLNSNYLLYPKLRKMIQRSADGIDISFNLTQKECSLLEYLHYANGKPVSKAELLTKIWGYADISETHTVETNIYRLRQKIRQNQNLIINQGQGYAIVQSKFIDIF